MLPADLLQATIATLGAQLIDADQAGCRFEHRGYSWALKAQPGVSGEFVTGRMRLEIVLPERDPQKILLALYLDAGLHEALPFPAWLGMDPEDDMLCLFFAHAGGAPNADSLAAMVNQATDLGSREDFLQIQEGVAPAY